jgi:hypothetical protein
MIGCDGCNGWFHGRCVGINDAIAKTIETYLCPSCDPSDNPENYAAHRKQKEREEQQAKKVCNGFLRVVPEMFLYCALCFVVCLCAVAVCAERAPFAGSSESSETSANFEFDAECNSDVDAARTAREGIAESTAARTREREQSQDQREREKVFC